MAAPRLAPRPNRRLRSIIVVTAAVLAAGVAVPAAAHSAVAPHASQAPVNPRTHLRPGVTPKSNARTRNAAPAGAHLTYYGGHVISNVQVIQVLYGAGTYTPEVANTAAPSIASFYGAVTNSSYYDWLSEYNTTINASGGGPGTNQIIGRGSFSQQIQITPSAANSGATVDDTNIQAELAAQISAGHLPTPNANTYYAVYFPAGVTITQGGSSSGVQFCAYHGTVAAAGSTPEFYYGVLPDFTTGGMTVGCGAGTRFQNETSVSSHELVEATTDAEVGLATVNGPPLAWYDATNGEIGDICNGQQQAIVGGDGRTYTVQQEWSNAQNNCVVSAPTVVNDFSISASPSSVGVQQGGSGTSTISTAVTSGSAGSVALSVSGAPSGSTATLSPSSVTAGGSSTLTINAGTAAAGSYTLTVTGVEGSKTHSASVALTVTAPAGNDFSISASPSSVSVAAGGSGTSTISTAVTSGSAGSVALTVSGAPSGSTATLSPSSVTAGGSSTLTINSGTAAAGSYTLTVTGVEGSATHSTSVSLTVTSAGGGGVVNGGFETGTFAGWTTGGAHTAISTTAHTGSYAAMLGNTTPTNGDSTISQTVTVPTNGQLSFWYKMTCPDTVTYDWALVQVKSTGGTVLTTPLAKTCATNASWVNVTASLSAYAGTNVVLLFTSHDDNYGADPSYTLYDDVAVSAASNDFSISASPSSLSLAPGGSGNSTISTAVTSGSAGSAALSVSGAPSGSTATLSPSSVTAGGSSTLTINAGTAAAGSYTLTVTGVEGSVTHSTSVSLTVTAPASNDFSISASPSSVSVAAGGSGTSTISTAVTSGSAGSVALTVSGAPSGSTATLSPTSVTAGGSATLTINSGTAAAGSYTLTVTGVEGSATHSTSVSLTVTSAGGGGVVNGGFETGTFAGWTTGGAHTAITTTAHSGSYAAMLGNTVATNGDSTISQTVAVPTNGQLSFWYKMTCPDTVTYDWATVQVKSTGGTVLSTPLARTCATNSSWVNVTASLSAYAGTSVVLLFTSHDDNYGADPSYTLYDDVAVNAASGGGGGVTNGGFETGTFSGWTSGGAHTAITTTAHSGSYAAMLGNTTATNGDSWIKQTVTIPATATNLSFWYANRCPDTVTYDWTTMQIQSTGGSVLATPLARTCASSYAWTNVTYNVTSLRGQTVVLYFLSHDDNYAGDPTYTLFDDITLS